MRIDARDFGRLKARELILKPSGDWNPILRLCSPPQKTNYSVMHMISSKDLIWRKEMVGSSLVTSSLALRRSGQRLEVHCQSISLSRVTLGQEMVDCSRTCMK